jgi:hypothetical protein
MTDLRPEAMLALADKLDSRAWEDRQHRELRGKAAATLRAIAAQGEVVVTRGPCDRILAVTRQDEDGRILSVIATSPPMAGEPAALLASQRREIERAIKSAEHPKGMSTHDGKASIDASILRRLLMIADAAPSQPMAGEP